MKAAVFYNCGDASQIEIAEIPEPEIGPGQALIRVHASAFNHLELWSLHGPADDSYRFPMWTGSDISGVIEGLAPDVSGWSVGDVVVVNPSLSCGTCPRCLEGEVSQCDDYDILGSNGNGGNAEYVVADAGKLMLMPAGFDFVLAAAAPLAYQTAWRRLERMWWYWVRAAAWPLRPSRSAGCINSTYPLEQPRQAYEHYERGQQFGKIVLSMSNQRKMT